MPVPRLAYEPMTPAQEASGPPTAPGHLPADSYQDLLQGIDILVGHGQTVDFSNLVADVEGGLSVDHAAVHDARHQAAPVLGHLQSDALPPHTHPGRLNTGQQGGSRQSLN